MPKARKHVSQLGEKTRKHNGGRYKTRANEPKPADFAENSPEHLTAAQRTIWADLVSRIAPGVLTSCDVYILELTTRLTEKMRVGELNATQTGQYRGCLASLGITPADRSRVQATPPIEKSLLEIILEGRDECEHKPPN